MTCWRCNGTGWYGGVDGNHFECKHPPDTREYTDKGYLIMGKMKKYDKALTLIKIWNDKCPSTQDHELYQWAVNYLRENGDVLKEALTKAKAFDEMVQKIIGYTDNEITNYPVWGIVSKGNFGKLICHNIPWFNREDAEQHLQTKKHRYPKSAFVYCFSGEMSWHYKELVDLARANLTEKYVKESE